MHTCIHLYIHAYIHKCKHTCRIYDYTFKSTSTIIYREIDTRIFIEALDILLIKCYTI